MDQTSSLVSSSSVVPDIEAGGECAYTSVLCSVIETIWMVCNQCKISLLIKSLFSCV